MDPLLSIHGDVLTSIVSFALLFDNLVKVVQDVDDVVADGLDVGKVILGRFEDDRLSPLLFGQFEASCWLLVHLCVERVSCLLSQLVVGSLAKHGDLMCDGQVYELINY